MPKSFGCFSFLNDLYTSILGDELNHRKVGIDHGPTLVIHGGAGNITRKNYSEQKEYLDALKESLMTGYRILLNEGNSIDAVEAAVRIMEGS
jgi:beta-aspartyl-peptidase (threonine type)